MSGPDHPRRNAVMPDRANDFWAKVDRSWGPDACWLWTGHCYPAGYGYIWWDDKPQGAHRVSYEIHHGPIPAGLVVRHHCDNRPCVNPAHLATGSVRDNNRDAWSRGRASLQKLQQDGVFLGEGNPRAILTTTLVVEARRLAGDGWGPTAIARQLGVTKQSIQHVLHRRTWTHVA